MQPVYESEERKQKVKHKSDTSQTLLVSLAHLFVEFKVFDENDAYCNKIKTNQVSIICIVTFLSQHQEID